MVQVETFECSETAAEPIEATEEAIQIIEQLGLDGQRELVAPLKREGFDQRCPYREITAEERFVYSVLCPTRVKIKDYKASPMPVRVLQIAAHAQSLGLFDHLEVWDRIDVTVHDPVLVAHTEEHEWRAGNKLFILARWGDELETFSVLLKRAVDSYREKLIASAQEALAQVTTATPAQIIEKGNGRLVTW